MSSRPDPVTAELRLLVARLEASGLADTRPDIQAILTASRQRLAATRRPPGQILGRLGGKLRAVGPVGLDVVALLQLVPLGWALWQAPSVETLVGHGGGAGLAVAAILLPWALWRLGQLLMLLLRGLREPAFWLRYHLRYGYTWIAEAFSPAAEARLQASSAALGLMRHWRGWARTLPERAQPADLETFVSVALGPRGRAMLLATGFDAHSEPALAWSRLILIFEVIQGAMTPIPAAAPPAPPAGPPPPDPVRTISPEEAVVAHEAEQHERERMELRNEIIRKKKDLSTAYTWKVKTSAEIAERDRYADEVRGEIAGLEAALKKLRAPGA